MSRIRNVGERIKRLGQDIFGIDDKVKSSIIAYDKTIDNLGKYDSAKALTFLNNTITPAIKSTLVVLGLLAPYDKPKVIDAIGEYDNVAEIVKFKLAYAATMNQFIEDLNRDRNTNVDIITDDQGLDIDEIIAICNAEIVKTQ